MKVIDFSDVHYSYKQGSDVLRGISFSLEAGEVVGLLGKNGAGKTTLMRLAMGMMVTSQGSVQLFGLDPRRDALDVKRRVGYVSEDQVLPEFLSVGEIIRLHRGLFPTWDEGLERRLRERFALSPKAKIKTLSKGQARQVALLCAVAHRPEVLLLDEPAGGLDPSARREFLETSIRLLNEAGTTILFSSHYMSDVERMAGRIAMIHEGRLLIDNSLDDLREKYSLALVPRGSGDRQNQLLGLKECLSVRDQADAIHAIFRCEPERCRSILEKGLDIHNSFCTPIALEDMFIELVGGRS
ncbi:MAG: ytrB [Acidobacteria bacterium]|jgi:ABC-2 type transport system ATP-binding protein|nr:ytrB [Acidobacteriota bacterium]